MDPNTKAILKHAEQMKASALQFSKLIPGLVQQQFSKMSNEDGEKFKTMLNDSGVLEKVKSATDKIKDLNKDKND